MQELTEKQKRALVEMGVCIWMAALFLLAGVLTAMHEAIRVEAGKGDSWIAAISLVFLMPGMIAFSLCAALRLWLEEFSETDTKIGGSSER